MAVRTEDLLTPEQLKDNYEYKVTKKAILREYPWIKDVTFNEDKLNQYNLIFLDFHVNPFELAEKEGWGIARWTLRDISEGNVYYSPYISSMMNISYEEGKPLSDELDDFMASIHKSTAIPQELHLPKDRKLHTGNFYTQEGLTIPTSYVDWRNTF